MKYAWILTFETNEPGGCGAVYMYAWARKPGRKKLLAFSHDYESPIFANEIAPVVDHILKGEDYDGSKVGIWFFLDRVKLG